MIDVLLMNNSLQVNNTKSKQNIPNQTRILLEKINDNTFLPNEVNGNKLLRNNKKLQ
jgi:hypothetical protein